MREPTNLKPLRRRHGVTAVCTALLIAFTVAARGAAGPRATAAPDAAGQLGFGGLSRTYTVHVPAGVTRPSALVVNLHGGGGTGAGEEALTHYDAVADAHGFVVVYPDGIDKNWADGRGASPPDRNGIDDVGFLVALVGKLVHDYGIDGGHVFATGMSNGAFMANRLACERADVLAAIAPVAGNLGTDVACAPSRPVAVLAVHGTTDPIVPFGGGQMRGRGGSSTIVAAPTMAARWRELDGCQGDPAEDVLPDSGDGTQVHRITAATCANGTSVVFMQIDGGGHTWPGGTQYLPKAVIGPTSHAFDASEIAWEFFASHAR